MGLMLQLCRFRRDCTTRRLDALQSTEVYVWHSMSKSNLEQLLHVLHSLIKTQFHHPAQIHSHRSTIYAMELWFSKTSLLGVVLTSAFTSALVIPRGHHDSVPASDVYKGGDQNHYPSESHGSGYSYPTTMARSSDIGLQTSSTPCATSSTATVTVAGSSIASLALQTGRYPISDGSTIYGQGNHDNVNFQ